MKLGIIAAAGKATRFSGIPKELMPLGGKTLIERHVRALKTANCDPVVVVSRLETIAMHANILNGYRNVVFRLQEDETKDIWGAIDVCLTLSADRTLFVMGDTFMDINPMSYYSDHGLTMYAFKTMEPQRFGIITADGGHVVNKPKNVSTEFGPSLAWGALEWDRDVTRHWQHNPYDDYTLAINGALTNFQSNVVPINFYYDIGDWEHYIQAADRIGNGAT